MSYQPQYQFGPSQTPRAVLNLIIITAIVSIFCSLFDSIFVQFLGIPGPEKWLGLSSWGIRQGFLWQLLTYLFVQDTASQGITVNFIIVLLFNMYVVWVMGSTILEFFSTKAFYTLYFLSAFLAGLLAVGVMFLTGNNQLLTGPIPAVLALLIVWTMLYPETELLLFFVLPVKTKWLTTGILAAIFLMSLSRLDLVSMTFYFVGALTGYFYALFSLDLNGPFPFMHPFERMVKGWIPKGKNDKIIPITRDSDILDDNLFLDAMLSKIAAKGEQSLTWREKRRLQEISEKKARRK